MAAILLHGEPVAEKIRSEVTAALAGRRPRVAAIHNEKNAAVRVYMKRQRAVCEKGGIPYDVHPIGDAPPEEVYGLAARLANDPTITGITVHQPLPEGVDEGRVLSIVPAAKDIEASQPESLGRLVMGLPGPQPAAARAAIEILRAHRPSLRGLDAVVVGRSALVGKPAALMLLAMGADAPTVTVCHTATADLASHTARADVLVVAAGRPNAIRGSMVKRGAIVVDIGINKLPEGPLVGDVAFDEAREIASAITPVPGGVGPVAIAVWLRNIVECATAARVR
ncbi:MAG: bifunctional 5,10-methylenetetrahydrofolate dehydrogenase/5,10-methenyltetrahydrofolate cyclohydrolase [Planctomycetes bacterium]|nr:bifunctional 5,10-methylenetetrahydrofolate dehydrogenase/5,10-methenyltetrahydrofolate cyclohydrolase [Planctomycetota bacterium]